MLTATRTPIPVVVQQHTDDCIMLRTTRSTMTSAPHIKLHQLRRIDDRIAAHLDGLAVAGKAGSKLVQAALANPGVGEIFTATVRALAERHDDEIKKLISLAQALPESQTGLFSAFGWTSAQDLRGVTKMLLESTNTFHRQVGITACAMHGVDPGPPLNAAIIDNDSALRACSLRAAGALGKIDLLPLCLSALKDADGHCRFQAARSALLLGDRADSIAALQTLAIAPGIFSDAALKLLLKIATPSQAHSILKSLTGEKSRIRALIQGVGCAGDSHYVPWLIKQMDDLKLTRLAGESFSLITGLDLALLDLDRKPPEGGDFGPSDDPKDDNIALDQDSGLPWPDPVKIAAWWQANGAQFAPGTCFFMGKAPSSAHCLAVLTTGFQRQRIAAAQYLCLLQPGARLFNTAAPAWRQKRLLTPKVD